MRMKWMMIAILVAITGCEDNDERLARFAEQAVQTQQRQNELLARTSEKVVDESHQLAEAAKQVVAADAQARSEMIAAQRQLQHEIGAERSRVDQQKEGLDAERRAMAVQRGRDPIIAAAIQSTSLLLACMLPLFLVGYALWQMNRQVEENVELGNLLIDELTSPQPTLLPLSSRLRLGPTGITGENRSDSSV